MEPRVSIITLGVSDLNRARRFYEALGLKPGMVVEGDVAFFPMGGSILGLWMREKLAADIGADGFASGPSPIALAYNTRSESEVDALLAQAEAAGGQIVKPAQKAFYGGWCGYFSDPDGHLWEVAHNPGFPLDEKGRISLPA